MCTFQDTTGSVNSFTEAVCKEDVLNGNTKHLAVVSDQFKGQSIRSSMEHLSKEVRVICRPEKNVRMDLLQLRF